MNQSFDADSILDGEAGYSERLSRSRIISFTPHAKLRGVQRNVSEKLSWETMQQGTKERSIHGRWKFVAEGVTVITDPDESEVITSWRTPGHGIVLR